MHRSALPTARKMVNAQRSQQNEIIQSNRQAHNDVRLTDLEISSNQQPETSSGNTKQMPETNSQSTVQIRHFRATLHSRNPHHRRIHKQTEHQILRKMHDVGIRTNQGTRSINRQVRKQPFHYKTQSPTHTAVSLTQQSNKQHLTMGLFSNDEQQTKSADNSGNISNSLELQENANLTQILLIIITILKLIEIAYLIYTSHVRKIKKRYGNIQNVPLNQIG